MERIKGIAVSAGIAIAPVHHYASKQISVLERPVMDPQAEWKRFESAVERSATQLQAIQAQGEKQLGAETVAIFAAQNALLHDPELRDRVRQGVFQDSCNIEFAFARAIDEFIALFAKMDNPYLRERISDLKDIRQRVLLNLQSNVPDSAPLIQQLCVLVAEDLSPSDMMQLDLKVVLALCIAKGGRTSHAAILARSLGIPAVVAMGESVQAIPEGRTVIVDGTQGELLIDPDSVSLKEYEKRQIDFRTYSDTLLQMASAAAITQDGKKITVAGNANRAEDVELSIRNGAEGIGLLRTEFLYMQRQSLPTEDELTAIYARIAGQVAPASLIVRMLDIGGDKPLPYLEMPVEDNPFLGKRGIRFLLDQPDLLHTGLRALLRANHEAGNIKLMLPMISQVEEIQAIQHLITLIREASPSETAGIEIGMMVETPAAALMADQYCEWVDFFSIGTNDLTQYTLAIDRGNPSMADYYDAYHPSVLRLIAGVVDAAHARGIWVGVCGDLASDAGGAVLLTGLGVDELSVSPASIPYIKDAIRNLQVAQAEDLAKVALHQSTTTGVRQLFARWNDRLSS